MDVAPSEICTLILVELVNLGLTDVKPVPEGKQNYVYTYSSHGEKRILKVTDARHRSLKALQTQSEMLKELSISGASVCAPVTDDELSIRKLTIKDADFYAIAYPFAKGRTPDVKSSADIRMMGTSLAKLHKIMRKLKPYSFPAIAETVKLVEVQQIAQSQEAEAICDAVARHFEDSNTQLLHGDFNVGNLKIDEDQMSIFDFDNCLYGTTAYELAQTLYMVLFSQTTRGEISVYKAFRNIFLEAYFEISDDPIDIRTIEHLIGYRVLMLASWLAKPNNAPLFIRQSSQIWLDTLSRFIETYFKQIAPSN